MEQNSHAFHACVLKKFLNFLVIIFIIYNINIFFLIDIKKACEIFQVVIEIVLAWFELLKIFSWAKLLLYNGLLSKIKTDCENTKSPKCDLALSANGMDWDKAKAAKSLWKGGITKWPQCELTVLILRISSSFSSSFSAKFWFPMKKAENVTDCCTLPNVINHGIFPTIFPKREVPIEWVCALGLHFAQQSIVPKQFWPKKNPKKVMLGWKKAMQYMQEHHEINRLDTIDS